MAETVLVTGGTGYVAGWCIVALLERGYIVRTTVRSLSREKELRTTFESVAGPSGDRLQFHIADLTSKEGWAAAMRGVDYVLHVASPLGSEASSDPNVLIEPARDGTLHVLRAAVDAGVRRVVMTSAATAATPPTGSSYKSVSDESVWFDESEPNVDAYRISKRLAERAAWEFMRTSGGATSLVTILPGAVFGPLLSLNNLGSVQLIQRLLDGKVPGSPRLGLEVVDVRDLADLHIRAMTSPEAAGERFLGVGPFMWMSEIASLLRIVLSESGRKVSTRTLPDWLVKVFARFDKSMQWIVPRLGREHRHVNDKAVRRLGWALRPVEETLRDCAESLRELRKKTGATTG